VAVGGTDVKVSVGGIDVIVDLGTVVSVGTTLAAGAQEASIKATSKTVTMFLIFIDTLLCKELPNYVLYGGVLYKPPIWVDI
jgi:hypothetical protein